MEPKTTQELVHNGKRIVITTGGEARPETGARAAASPAPAASPSPAAPKVTIDGESVPVQYDPDTKKYIATSHSPYLNHDSLIDLAKHVADHVIAQRSP